MMLGIKIYNHKIVGYTNQNVGVCMGYIVKLQCNYCDYEKIVHLGNGRRDFDSNVVATYFNNKEILDLIFEHNRSWIFEWKLARCKQCSDIHRVPTVMCLDEQGQKTEWIEAECACGSDECSLIDVEEVCCNKCSQKYYIEKIGLWD